MTQAAEAPTPVTRRRDRGRHRTTRTRHGRVKMLGVAAVLALVSTASTPAVAADARPVGSLDVVRETLGVVRVSGWAWDRHEKGPITVAIRVGGTVTTVRADQPRTDVARAHPEAGSHRGFTAILDASAASGPICVTAVGATVERALGCRTADPGDGVPGGHLDEVTATAGTVHVRGWALDADATGPATVHLTVGTTSVDVSAQQPRRDVAAAMPGLRQDVGFAASVAAPGGRVQVCAAVENVGPGATRQLGCRTVTVPRAAQADPTPPTPSPTPSTAAPDPAPSPTPSPSPSRSSAADRGSAPTRSAPPAPTSTPSAPATSDPGPSSSPSPTASSRPAAVGVPAGTKLTIHDGDLHVTKAGTVVDSLDIRGYLHIEAPDVTVKNTIVRGRPGLTYSQGLVVNTAGNRGLTIVDSELAATDHTPWVNGFMGSNVTMKRVDIHDVVDSIHLTGGNVLVEDSYLHGNLYFTSTPWGGETHTDNIQIQGGDNIVVRNSVLRDAKYAGVMITQDSGPVTHFVFTGNDADNGSCTINLVERAGPIAATITNNLFGTGQRIDHCAVIAQSGTRAASTVTGNRFTDGRPFAISRG